MPKKKTALIITGIIILVTVILLTVIILTFSSLEIAIQGLPHNPQQDFTWQGINGVMTATYFGRISNEPRREFCESNDNDVTLFNGYEANDRLTIESWISAVSRPCGTNTIYAEMEFQGTLTGNCELSSENNFNGQSRATCRVFSGSAMLHESQICSQRGSGDCPTPNDLFESFELTFDELSQIKIELTTSVGSTGRAVVLLELEVDQVENGDNGNGNGNGNGEPINWDLIILGIAIGLLIIGVIVVLIIKRK